MNDLGLRWSSHADHRKPLKLRRMRCRALHGSHDPSADPIQTSPCDSISLSSSAVPRLRDILKFRELLPCCEARDAAASNLAIRGEGEFLASTGTGCTTS